MCNNNAAAFCSPITPSLTTGASSTFRSACPISRTHCQFSSSSSSFTSSLKRFSYIAAAKPAPSPAGRRLSVRCAFPGNIEDLPVYLIPEVGGMPPDWRYPGVYGVYNAGGQLQFIASTLDVAGAIAGHRATIKDPSLVHSARMMLVNAVEDAPLDDFAEAWVVAHHEMNVPIPPGNTDEAPIWREEPFTKDVSFSGAIKAGSPEQRVELEIKRILMNNNCVVFMKGTSDSPRCGFSKSVVDILDSHPDVQYVAVDCLDANKNPGLREGIKTFSQWPTIPQLYISGDFVGGADIVAQMNENGELAAMLHS